MLDLDDMSPDGYNMQGSGMLEDLPHPFSQRIGPVRANFKQLYLHAH
jgi:hypothetical protein